jgi:hypothetical protein
MPTQKLRFRSGIWGLLSLLLGAASSSDAQIVGTSPCDARYRDHILGSAIPDDVTDLLVAAQGVSLGFLHPDDTRTLRDLAERKLWLKAMGEPQPPLASVGEALTQRWPEDLEKLRQRGAQQILQLQTVALWTGAEPPPQFAARADNETGGPPPLPNAPSSRPVDEPAKGTILYARFRIVNTGHQPVSALTLVFPSVRPTYMAEPLKCSWRPMDPLRPGDHREIACQFEVENEWLESWRHSLESPSGATFHEVSFSEQNRNVPYIPYDLTNVFATDPEIERLGRDRERSTCSRNALGATVDWANLGLWVVLPGVFGTYLGRRFARPARSVVS